MSRDTPLDLTNPVLRHKDRPHVVVLGNEKGGAGKSTTAMHVAVALLHAGHRVATVDLDARQGTLTRYVENRNATALRESRRLLRSAHVPIHRSTLRDRDSAEAEEKKRLADTMEMFRHAFDVVVIDTPGTDTNLGRLGHGFADTLVTPMNDSFLDLDVLATIDPQTNKIVGPSIYAEMVWQSRKQKLAREGTGTEWIVMRNRLSALDSRNKRQINDLLEELGRRLGFRVVAGFGERVVFRELFLKGLTLLDLDDDPKARTSHAAARAEVDVLLRAIGVHSA